MANARAKAEQASSAAAEAKQDSDIARLRAKEIDPNFHQPGKVTELHYFVLEARKTNPVCF